MSLPAGHPERQLLSSLRPVTLRPANPWGLDDCPWHCLGRLRAGTGGEPESGIQRASKQREPTGAVTIRLWQHPNLFIPQGHGGQSSHIKAQRLSEQETQKASNTPRQGQPGPCSSGVSASQLREGQWPAVGTGKQQVTS